MIASPVSTLTGKSGFVPGNQVTLLQNGEAFFPAIEQAFDRAKSEIYLVTYIYRDDSTGQKIAAALKRAVLRGVRVYVVVDASEDCCRGPRDCLCGRDQYRRRQNCSERNGVPL